MSRLPWLLLLASFLAPPAGAAKDERLSAEERYELGMKYMKRGYYTRALEQFTSLRNYYRDDPHATRAELAMGDLHFKKAEWDQARLIYEDFLRMHPRHEEADYVTLRIGLCMWRKAPSVAGRDQSWTRHAVNTWTGFERRFPDSEYVDEVLGYLEEGRERLARKELVVARFYANRDAWEAAMGRLEFMLDRWPESMWEHDARALLGQALHHSGDSDAAMAQLALLQEEGADGREVTRLEKLLQ